MLFVNFDLRQSAPHMIAHARKEFFIKMADVGRPKVEVDLDDVEFLQVIHDQSHRNIDD